LQDDIDRKLLDVLEHPEKYREVVEAVRRHLAAHHSYEHRLHELVETLESEQSAVLAG
jgi:hypothetical protein